MIFVQVSTLEPKARDFLPCRGEKEKPCQKARVLVEMGLRKQSNTYSGVTLPKNAGISSPAI